MKRYKNKWIKLGERLHPAEYMRYNKATEAFKKIRNDEKIETFGGKLESHLYSGDYSAALMMLKTRAGEFARKLDYLLRTVDNKNLVINSFLDKIERRIGSKKFRNTFKTITCDNGCENLDFEGIERAVSTKKDRTKVYYAHPYSAWERGTNENTNKLIRRFIPKGADIGKYTSKEIKLIEHWINNYPRRIFNGLSSNDILMGEMK